jgi:hypothetical protein
MEPESTFAEVGRLLRPGGVFCAYQYDSLLTPFWEPEEAFAELRARFGRLRVERGLDREKRRWSVSLEPFRRAGWVARCRELHVQSVEHGDADRLVGFALSEGSLTTLLATGVTEAEVGLDRLREVAARTIGATPCAWLIGYTVWVAVRR